MKNIFTLIVVFLTGFASIAQVEKTIVVEHFTNTLCGTCASRNPALFSLLDNYPQVLHISYHPSAPYSNCIFHQHNPVENDARTNFYGIYGGTPRVVLQGEVVPVQNPILTAGQIDAVLSQTSDFKITVTQEQADANMVNVQVVVKKVSESFTQTPVIFGMIAEKEIQYAAPNGENLHHNVFRKVIIDADLNIANVGDSAVINESYSIHPDWIADELIFTVLVQNESTGGILQAAESDKLSAGSSFIGDKEILSLDGALYPNPARDVINISASMQEKVLKTDFYAMTGKLVKSYSGVSAMNISDLPEGIYMVVLTDKEQKQHITRIVKR